MESYEKEFGQIQEHSLLMAHTGWHSRWHSSDRYRNADENGKMIFPSVHESVAEKYISRICGIGIDTFSPDCNDTFPVHHVILGAGKIIIENIGEELEKLPRIGAYAICLPLKIQDGTESPVRLIGFSE